MQRSSNTSGGVQTHAERMSWDAADLSAKPYRDSLLQVE
jgi:hypothetical protein